MQQHGRRWSMRATAHRSPPKKARSGVAHMFSLSLQWLVLALDTSIKAALLALLAAAALRAMKLGDSNVRHRVWTGVLLGMLLLPVLARMIPALRLPLPFKLDRLTAFQLDDLDSQPAADAATTPNSASEIPATF